MRSLNLDQLRTLATVARLGSFSAAARELNLTQPAVSLQIRELESRLGLRLVDRVGKQARATSAGCDLIAHAEIMAKRTARLRQRAVTRRDTRSVSISGRDRPRLRTSFRQC